MTDTGGRVLAQASAGYAVTSAMAGYAESDPAHWWSAVTACAREAVAARPSARAARGRRRSGCPGRCTAWCWRPPTAQALRPALLWADSRATGSLRAYRLLGAGRAGPAGQPAGPRDDRAAAHVGRRERTGHVRRTLAGRWQPKDWMRARLTGEFHAEPSDASASLLYDVPGDRWDLEVVSALGLDASLLAPAAALGRSAGRAPDRRGRGPSWGCPRASRSRPGPPTRRPRPSAAASARATSS